MMVMLSHREPRVAPVDSSATSLARATTSTSPIRLSFSILTPRIAHKGPDDLSAYLLGHGS